MGLFNQAAKCWGNNVWGNLGLGDRDSRGKSMNEMGNTLPYVNLGRFIAVNELSAGDSHSCARVNGNQVKCWGNNRNGALGLGDVLNRGDVPWLREVNYSSSAGHVSELWPSWVETSWWLVELPLVWVLQLPQK